MKRLSMLAALTALVAPGIFATTAQAQQLNGTIVQEFIGNREYPAGYNETGRYARFIQDERLTDLNLKNRDYEAWKPLDAQSKQFVRHFLRGKANTSDTIVPDQEIGRYVRMMEDDRLISNDMEFNDRTFYGYQIESPYTAEANKAMVSSYLRGLPAGTNFGIAMPRHGRLPISATPRLLYFWQ